MTLLDTIYIMTYIPLGPQEIGKAYILTSKETNFSLN